MTSARRRSLLQLPCLMETMHGVRESNFLSLLAAVLAREDFFPTYYNEFLTRRRQNCPDVRNQKIAPTFPLLLFPLPVLYNPLSSEGIRGRFSFTRARGLGNTPFLRGSIFNVVAQSDANELTTWKCNNNYHNMWEYSVVARVCVHRVGDYCEVTLPSCFLHDGFL